MKMNEYQDEALKTAIVKDNNILYTVLGISGEAGEVSEKMKKIIRDQDGVMTEENKKELAKEIGDVLWYLAVFADEIGYTLDKIGRMNIKKLKDRKKRGVIHGEGDNR